MRLTEDGEPGTATITREWAAGAALDDAQARPEAADVPRPLAAKGWTRPLELYRRSSPTPSSVRSSAVSRRRYTMRRRRSSGWMF
ncbi:MAG: hypothetical protein ACRDPD_26585 [Streptosporangiaceae bacterium]